MKKILSIFMLFVMLVVGIAPTVGMHFCGERLRSVEISSISAIKTCCPKSAINTIDGNLIESGCCKTTETQIITDTYYTQERESSVSTFLFSFTDFWIPTPIQAKFVNINTNLSKHFPPEGFDVKNRDILGFICIFRI